MWVFFRGQAVAGWGCGGGALGVGGLEEGEGVRVLQRVWRWMCCCFTRSAGESEYWHLFYGLSVRARGSASTVVTLRRPSAHFRDMFPI